MSAVNRAAIEDWSARIRRGEKRAVARGISWIENRDPRREPLLESLHPHTGNAFLIGVTGAPGAGKSSLVDRLIDGIRREGKTVGVVAVDPTSPFTGGSLLGDRVRMTRHALDKGVFIRSMGSRGNLGGLSRGTREAVRVLDAAGLDVIFVETVGVGQSEIDIMHMVDTVALVLTPGSGDAVQVFKAGIMEAADLFVVNKADQPGTQRLVKDIGELLDLTGRSRSWRPPIVETTVKEGRSIDALWRELLRHRHHLTETGEGERRHRDHLRREVEAIMEEELRSRLQKRMRESRFTADLDRVHGREWTPHEMARNWLDRLSGRERGNGG
ncbi:methylmalonyl Co-A mutase-associated GTPase MeaB [Desmospora profundinema]|uniref:LAO/AO transport system kinase n=1 Tax=Desmospora profundinema TaxID=1571184 RepID=A0ABU1IL55_9BACL|nr:methylmalonyl Co-A mutase-associated GTPase MeaB [Desmospora profundinema]MDR6225473.1 LAO/AO transport system kinase [Desmospora profundinema]